MRNCPSGHAIYLPGGHATPVLQDTVWVAGPVHGAPPLAGAGEVQLLDSIWVPVGPHVAEHGVEGDHDAQAPSAVKKKRIRD